MYKLNKKLITVTFFDEKGNPSINRTYDLNYALDLLVHFGARYSVPNDSIMTHRYFQRNF